MDPAPSPVDRTVAAARRRAELPMLMRQITGQSDPPGVGKRTILDFGEGLTVLIDQEWLQRMSVDEADAIGRAISATLLDYPNLIKGKDPKS
ncbi:MAG: hypothetical protein EBS42_14255 [Caulobacteraceae bacterium]|nr:hypothetical protein [Caulobacteraceae bacterium]